MSCPAVGNCPRCGHSWSRHKDPFSPVKNPETGEIFQESICLECAFGKQVPKG